MSVNDLLDSEWVLPLLLIAGLAFFIGMPLLISKQEKNVFGGGADLSNVRTVAATIIDKRTEHNYLTQNIVVTHVVFQLEGGGRVDLAVRDAATMVVGDKGMLRYSGSRFVSFQRDT